MFTTSKHLFRTTLAASALLVPAGAAAYHYNHADPSRSWRQRFTTLWPSPWYQVVDPRAFAEAQVPLNKQRTIYDRITQRLPELPDIAASEVRACGKGAEKVLVTYGNGVFDITEFVEGHPGGEVILLAAGGPLEPFFETYALHKKFFVYEILEEMRVGNLITDEEWEKDLKHKGKQAGAAAYVNEPERSKQLIVRSERPYTAEPPARLLVDSQLTPNELFYVRNHMPVPVIDGDDYELTIVGVDGEVLGELSLEDLKTKFVKHTVAATLQCAGNRRTELNEVRQVKGGTWDVGAIGNAEWSGARLSDVLQYVQQQSGKTVLNDSVRHVWFEGLDEDVSTRTRYEASIPVDVLRRAKDVLLAYEMNGEQLPRDHGYPIRAVVPGVVGARNVKWVGKVVLAEQESWSHWQRKDYRCVGSPDATVVSDEKEVDAAPSIQEMPIVSAICWHDVDEGQRRVSLGGYAFSGDGKAVVRVEVSADGGHTWKAAQLQPRRDSSTRETFDWTLWSAQVTVPANWAQNGELICRAIDAANNSQPRDKRDVWNVRGLLNNSWHRVRASSASTR
eukprot:TRINITY_DN1017_c0_g1_i1.p1 TRINITY_DN1017_c0_g1~~TRINITY_DN1017_c0_g1_i1.p1  ORF type:complete len:563 (+),score=82.12 TRINITY_DN1017_c0_g1_i1:191-1879(+)